jgi:hypothetical protein
LVRTYHPAIHLEPSLFGGSAKGTGGGAAEIDPRLASLLQLAVAAITIPVTVKTAPKLIQLAARLREVEREAEAAGVAAVSGPVRMGPLDLIPPSGHATVITNSPLVVGAVSLKDGREEIEMHDPDPDLVRPTALEFPEPALDRLLAEARRTA